MVVMIVPQGCSCLHDEGLPGKFAVMAMLMNVNIYSRVSTKTNKLTFDKGPAGYCCTL